MYYTSTDVRKEYYSYSIHQSSASYVYTLLTCSINLELKIATELLNLIYIYINYT